MIQGLGLQQPTKQWHSLKLEEQTLGKWADFFTDISRLSRQAVTLVLYMPWQNTFPVEVRSTTVSAVVTELLRVSRMLTVSRRPPLTATCTISNHLHTSTNIHQLTLNDHKPNKTPVWNMSIPSAVFTLETTHTHTYTRLTALFPGLPG